MGEAPLERELERTKRLLRLVLETGALNAAYVDRDRRHTWVHNSSDEPSEEEILGRTDMELFDEGMARPTSDIKQDAMESESRVNREFTFIKPWGQNRYRAAAEPLYDETGDVEGAMFAAVDISEQYRLLNRTTDAIYTVDEDWRVTFWNDRMATRTEIDPRDIVGENLWEAFGDDIPDELERRYREVMATGEPAEFEQYVPDPFDYWLELRVFADGNGLSIHSRDITERKEQEQRLTDQRDNLDVLNQVLRHDVRNDLHVVLAYADALVDSVDGEDGEYARKDVLPTEPHGPSGDPVEPESDPAYPSDDGERRRQDDEEAEPALEVWVNREWDDHDDQPRHTEQQRRWSQPSLELDRRFPVGGSGGGI